MLNFKHISNFFMILLTLQTSLQASDGRSRNSQRFMTFYYNPYPTYAQNQEHRIIKNGCYHYLELIHTSKTYSGYPAQVNDQKQSTHSHFLKHITPWLEQHDIDDNYKKFNEHIADYPIKTTLWWTSETLLEYALKKHDRQVIVNLTRHGANLNKPILECKNPCDYANKNHKQELLQLLENVIALHEKQDQQMAQIIQQETQQRRQKEIAILLQANKQNNQIQPQVTKLPVNLKNDDWSWKDI